MMMIPSPMNHRTAPSIEMASAAPRSHPTYVGEVSIYHTAENGTLALDPMSNQFGLKIKLRPRHMLTSTHVAISPSETCLGQGQKSVGYA
jgi:hypothetical protein